MSETPQTTEETWWELTYRTGLILSLPAPLTSTGEAVDPWGFLQDQATVRATSQITGKAYVYSLKDVAVIIPRVIKNDPERLKRSLLKASGTSLGSSSVDSPAPSSPSSETERPARRSTSAAGRRGIH